MCKKSNDVGKIYRTTDGYFTSSYRIKKPRRVAIIYQRKDDKAIAVVKIYSKKNKSGNPYISKLVLKPNKHPSLTEDSIVGKRLIIGKKENESYKAIYTEDFINLNDKVTRRELKKIKKAIKKINKNKIKKWQKHFRK